MIRIRYVVLALAVTLASACAPASEPAEGGLFTPTQHPLYDGRFIVSGQRVYQVGTLFDASPWDHMGDDATNLRPVDGTIEIDVDEVANTGTFRAEFELPEGRYYIRSPEANGANHPTRQVFDHFFAMEVTWR
jgi:hypothetical protein